jgi:hypothetical protein
MELQAAHRQALLDTLKNTIKESNDLKSIFTKMIEKSDEDIIMRTEIQLHLLILKIGMIETILIQNQIDL